MAVEECVGVAVGRAGVELGDDPDVVELRAGVAAADGPPAPPVGAGAEEDVPGCALLLGEVSVASSWCKRTTGSRPNTSMLELTSTPITTIQMVARSSTVYPPSPPSSQLLERSKGNS